MNILDPTPCELGEGAFWHPLRQEFFWFDILNRRLFSHDGEKTGLRDLPALFSAAGWIDRDTLVLSGEEGLFRYDLESGALTPIAKIEADRAETRSNDGRTDPWGGFWASTMGRKAEQGAGAIYRYHRGVLRKLHGGVTIPNAICFDRARARAYFADTDRALIWRQALDPETGWPSAEPDVHVDLSAEDLNPDGAETDTDGNLWNANWGAGLIACYDPQGRRIQTITVPARQASCPAFGGEDYSTLYVTTAFEGMDEAARAADPLAGKTFFLPVSAQGQPAPRFIV